MQQNEKIQGYTFAEAKVAITETLDVIWPDVGLEDLSPTVYTRVSTFGTKIHNEDARELEALSLQNETQRKADSKKAEAEQTTARKQA